MFIAMKPCSFAGHVFMKGDTIPDGLVQPQAVSRLTTGGLIAEAGNAGQLLPAVASIEKDTVEVPILSEGGEATLEMTVEDILTTIKAVQLPIEELKAEIATIDSEEVLILIDVLKDGIHDEAEARAVELAGIPQTEKELMALKRDELVEIAKNLGREVTDADTKQMLTDYILEVMSNE